jgi:hypothetical protein
MRLHQREKPEPRSQRRSVNLTAGAQPPWSIRLSEDQNTFGYAEAKPEFPARSNGALVRSWGHFWIGPDLKECFRIARLNLAQMESMSRKDREATKGGIEGHRLVILAKGTKAQAASQTISHRRPQKTEEFLQKLTKQTKGYRTLAKPRPKSPSLPSLLSVNILCLRVLCDLLCNSVRSVSQHERLFDTIHWRALNDLTLREPQGGRHLCATR